MAGSGPSFLKEHGSNSVPSDLLWADDQGQGYSAVSLSRGVGTAGCEQVLTKESREVPEPEMDTTLCCWVEGGVPWRQFPDFQVNPSSSRCSPRLWFLVGEKEEGTRQSMASHCTQTANPSESQQMFWVDSGNSICLFIPLSQEEAPFGTNLLPGNGKELLTWLSTVRWRLWEGQPAEPVVLAGTVHSPLNSSFCP